MGGHAATHRQYRCTNSDPDGSVARVAGRTVLLAERKGTWVALAATVSFSRVSCGYVRRSDGWTDLAGKFQMDRQFDRAPDDNIALTGELNLTGTREFTLGLAFGKSGTTPSRPSFER